MNPPFKGCILVLLASFITLILVKTEGKGFYRKKREWVAAPRQLKENHDYTGLSQIARIRSDQETSTKIYYYLSGRGVDQSPVGVFGIDRNTGYVRVYSRLDREKIAFYQLIGKATYEDGRIAEKDILLNITVVDENDCIPVIKASQVGYVNESSSAGTLVMKVTATDEDEENTLHSRIKYSIVEQSNMEGMFYINSQTGEVFVRKNTLDRETKDTYKLTIRASDMDGRAGGNAGTGEIEVKLRDINDNIPTLEKESYTGSVEENTVNVEVMRIQAVDMDLIHTENWDAVYSIISGNEGGYFSIVTDSKTNEGIIMVNKALDYEKLKVLNLKVAVANKAAYNFGSGSTTTVTSKSYPITINVVNQKEGPRFQPSVKVVNISEDQSLIHLNKIITTYAAIDSDTLQTATNVRYAKLRDNDNWLIIDEKTADIRLNKLPDRESKFLINGTYYAQIICYTNDKPSKTATGTIAIQVEDFNDHCPQVTTNFHTLCLEEEVIYVNAVDKDNKPNADPFDFTVIHQKSTGKWKVEPLNGTAVILRNEDSMWPGMYKVAVEVRDQQGKSCDDLQIMDVVVCTCNKDTKSCAERSTKTSGFGAPGILLLLLGFLLLILVPLLLMFCICGSKAFPDGDGPFKLIPFETKQRLMPEHTEGIGEDKEFIIPDELDGKKTGIYVPSSEIKVIEIDESQQMGGGRGGRVDYEYSTGTSAKYGHKQSFYDWKDMTAGQDYRYMKRTDGAFDGMALSHQFLGEYYLGKVEHATQQSLHKDALTTYNYEGQESPAGSIGCCSILENDNDLAFLDDLGPKFKTLAHICGGSTIVTETVDKGVSIPPLRPPSPFIPPPSSHSHTHTHIDTISGRDQNKSSSSSTFIQKEIITGSQATLPKVHVQDQYVIPSQTLLVQQPAMYVPAQPMYVVDSKPQMVLVSGTQHAVGQVGHVGLGQGLVQVGGVQVGGMQVGGMQAAQGMVLVDRQLGMGVPGNVAQGISQGTTSRSRQVFVVENGATGREQGAVLAQGFVQAGHGSTGHGVEVIGQSMSLGSRSSAGSHEDILLAGTPTMQGSKRVVVQQKMSVTERNVGSSSLT